MAAQPPKNKADRRRTPAPVRGEWQAKDGIGWQHGPIPKPPAKILKTTKTAWDIWFKAWFAAHWSPDDLPGLLTVAALYDAVQRGELQRASELRMWSTNYGINPRGQRERRWRKAEDTTPMEGVRATRCGHL